MFLSAAVILGTAQMHAQEGNTARQGKVMPYATAAADLPAVCQNPLLKSGTVKFAPASAPTMLFDQADGQAKVWGFLQFDYRYRTNAVVDFTTDNPDAYSMLNDYRQELGVSKVITAATFAGSTLYGYACTYYGPGALVPYAVGTIDPLTGAFSPIRSVNIASGLLINDMTYDPVTRKIYGVQFNENTESPADSYSNLYRIDPGTGETDSIGQVGYLLYTIASDVDGNLYGIARDMNVESTDNNNSFLVKIPADTIAAGQTTATPVAANTKLGVNVYYQQSMEFDRTNHRLWWLSQSSSGNPYLAEVDCKTGKLKSKYLFNSQAQITSLAIPYQQVEATAPSYPRSFTVTAAPKGGNEATLAWVNPSTDYMGDALTELSGVRVYRDGNLIHTADGTVAEAAQTYTDNTISEPGYYTYRVQGYNTAGDGVYKEARIFVGKDKPGKVRNIALATNGNTATLSWNSPENGQNDGWYDKASLSYKVVRQPDGKVVSEATADSTVTDNVSKYAGYYYQVIPSNAQGTGDTVSSKVEQFGPSVEIPYTDSLNTKPAFNEWKAIDVNNDGTTWFFDEGNKVTNYYYSLSAANDFLVSPPMTFDGNKQYQVRYTYYSSNWVTADDHTPIMEKMKVYYGQQATAAGLNTMIDDLGEFHTASGNYLYGKSTFKPKSGDGYVGFLACSDADCGVIYLKDVNIREYSATDVSLKNVQGSATANVNTPYSFGVDVTNEGNKAVSGFTIEIIDAQSGDVVAQKVVDEPLGVDETKNYSVEWTPDATGKRAFKARVVLDGDTYPLDNENSQEVYVTISSAAAQTWLTVNKDNSADGMGGWYIPFNFGSAFTQIDVIYLAKEMQLKNITLTGLQFVYDTPAATPASEANVEVNIGSTTQDYIICDPNDSYNVHFVDADFTKVYTGTVAIDGGEVKNCPLVINFTTPYNYSDGNIVVRYQTNVEADHILSGDNEPWWHYCNNYDDGDPQRYRTAIYRGKTSDINPDRVGWNYWTPFTMFAYTTANGMNGVVEPGQNGLDIHQDGTSLVANKTLDSAELIAASGAIVSRTASNHRINVAGLHGAYLLRYTVDGKTSVVKIVIK